MRTTFRALACLGILALTTSPSMLVRAADEIQGQPAATATDATATPHAPYAERAFIDLVMHKSAEAVVAAIGEPSGKSDVRGGMQMWVYRDIVLKPRQQTTFPVTQVVVANGQVVQIGHSQRDPLQQP